MQLKSAFNIDFYVLAATVIPIYFLALIFPNGILYRYWRQLELLHNRLATRSKERDYSTRVGLHALYFISLLPPVSVLVSGVVGETCAIVSVYRKNVFTFFGVPTFNWLVPLPGIAVLCIMILIAYETTNGPEDTSPSDSN